MIQLLQLRYEVLLRRGKRILGGLFFGALALGAFLQLGAIGDPLRIWNEQHAEATFSPKRTNLEEGSIIESYFLSPLEQDTIDDHEMFADLFGASMATQGGELYVGATRDCREGSFHGWVHCFRFDGNADDGKGRWVWKGDLRPDRLVANDMLGCGMAILGDSLFVGSYPHKWPHQALSIGKVTGFVRREDGKFQEAEDIPAPRIPKEARADDPGFTRAREFGRYLDITENWLAIHAAYEVIQTPKYGPLYLYRREMDGRSVLHQRLPSLEDRPIPEHFATIFALGKSHLLVESNSSASPSKRDFRIYYFDEKSDQWELTDLATSTEEIEKATYHGGGDGESALFTDDGHLLWAGADHRWRAQLLGIAPEMSRTRLVTFSSRHGLLYSALPNRERQGESRVIYHPIDEAGRVSKEHLILVPSMVEHFYLDRLLFADNGDVLVSDRKVSAGFYETGAVYVYRAADLKRALEAKKDGALPKSE